MPDRQGSLFTQDVLFQTFVFDIAKNPLLLGRLKLPYYTLNFLGLLAATKYDKSRDIIEICQYLYHRLSSVRQAIDKLAEYAVTDFEIVDDGGNSVSKLLEILNKLQLKEKLIEIGKYYFSTGNAFVSIQTDFERLLKCPKCEYKKTLAEWQYEWDWTVPAFVAKCDNCGYKGRMEVLDVYLRDADHIKIKIWDWHDIEFKYNSINDTYEYFYILPLDVVLGVKKGDPFYLKTTDWIYIEAIQRGSGRTFRPKVKFREGSLLHFKRPTTFNYAMAGWGEPVTVPIIQDAFYMMLLRQTQGILLADYMLMMRVLSPPTELSNVIDIDKYMQMIAKMVDDYKDNPMQILISPIPLTYQAFGGEGKALFYSNEIEVIRMQIAQGLGVPLELIQGTLNYSAANISLRIMENMMLNYTNTLNNLLNRFFVPEISKILGLKKFTVKLVKFRLIDDIQQKNLALMLYDRNLISAKKLFAILNIEPEPKEDLIESVKYKAEIEAAYKKTITDYDLQIESEVKTREAELQFKLNELIETLQKEKELEKIYQPENVDQHVIEQLAKAVFQVVGTDIRKAEKYFNNIASSYGEPIANGVKAVYLQLVSAATAEQGEPADTSAQTGEKAGTPKTPKPEVDMRPLPEQKPPRRKNPV